MPFPETGFEQSRGKKQQKNSKQTATKDLISRDNIINSFTLKM